MDKINWDKLNNGRLPQWECYLVKDIFLEVVKSNLELDNGDLKELENLAWSFMSAWTLCKIFYHEDNNSKTEW